MKRATQDPASISMVDVEFLGCLLTLTSEVVLLLLRAVNDPQ